MSTESLTTSERSGNPSTSTVVETNNPINVSLFSIAVVGEDTFWLGERRSKIPLPEEWRQTEVYWLYPVENASLPLDMERSGWFDPTDYIFELRFGDQYSKVLRLATMSTSVEAKKIRVGERLLFFVTAKEFQKAEDAYSLFLRNEAVIQESIKTNPIDTAVESVQNTSKETKLKVEAIETPEVDSNYEKLHFSTKKIAAKTPHTVPAAPPSLSVSFLASDTFPSQHIPLSEESIATARRILGTPDKVAGWQQYFIIHRGGTPLLCREFTGNEYGYKLLRAANDGFSVFLFFIHMEAPIMAVGQGEIGVPVLESCLLSGEETNFKRQREVLVFTRAVGSRKGAAGRKKEEIEAIASRREPKKWAVNSSSIVESKENEMLEVMESKKSRKHYSQRMTAQQVRLRTPSEESAPDLGSTRRGRGRPRKEVQATVRKLPFPSSLDKSVTTAGSRRQNTSSSEATSEINATPHSARRDTDLSLPSSTHNAAPLPPPLTAIGVNMYTNATEFSALSPTQLSNSYPLRVPSSSSQGLTTSVLPSGICVTYTTATASKIQQLMQSSERHGDAQHLSSVATKTDSGYQASSGGIVSPADAMRGLLENIKLAQEQASALS